LYNVVNKESSISELLADLDEEHDLEE
jgi:hypothetical protein